VRATAAPISKSATSAWRSRPICWWTSPFATISVQFQRHRSQWADSRPAPQPRQPGSHARERRCRQDPHLSRHISPMSGRRDASQSGPPLWTLVCPITNAIFEEPVVASDGRTYSKQALRSFISSCSERGLPVTSPLGKRSRRARTRRKDGSSSPQV
jgi:hypothetical protein